MSLIKYKLILEPIIPLLYKQIINFEILTLINLIRLDKISI